VRTLLVQSCSKSKNQPDGTVSAVDLYSGFFFRILKKARREDAFDSDVDLCILSAAHGIIDPDEKIAWYDQEMSAARAAELAPAVARDLAERAPSYDRIVVNAGEVYRSALQELDVEVPVYYIDGGGIGEKGHVLKQFIRDDSGTDIAVGGLVSDPEAP